MHRFLPVLAVALVMIVPSAAHTADVVVRLHNERTLEGELLVVRDSALLVDLKSSRRMWTNYVPDVAVVPFDSIRFVTVKGGTYLWAGFIGGAATGALIGLASGDDKEGSWYRFSAETKALFGGLLGMTIGSIVGGSISSTVRSVPAGAPGGFGALKPFARFVHEEPETLKEIRE